MDESPPPSSPSLLPQGEEGASRGALRAPSFTLGEGESDGRHFDRVRWRCRRGMLELDLILRGFLEQHYHELTPSEQHAFDRLLTTPDNTLLAYLQGTQNPSENELMQIVEKIRY